MIIEKTETFDKWYYSIKDRKTKAIIDKRLTRLELNNFGDVKSRGDGVSELRIHYGAGYRIYFTKCGEIIILLLCGGDKSSQEKDIKKAKEMLK